MIAARSSLYLHGCAIVYERILNQLKIPFDTLRLENDKIDWNTQRKQNEQNTQNHIQVYIDYS
jgi:hypothetical protein